MTPNAVGVLFWLPWAVAAAGIFYVVRHGGGRALEELERSSAVLERSLEAETEKRKVLENEVADLRTRTDIVLALNPVLEMLSFHEEMQSKRYEAVIKILGMIADRLGPDNGNIH